MFSSFRKSKSCKYDSNNNNIQRQKQKDFPNNNEKPVNHKKVYRCPYCSTIPELLNINFFENKITLKCPFHKEITININDYLSLLNFSICQECNLKILSEEKSFHCYNCKTDICFKCKNIHSKEHNVIDLNEYNIKCKVHYNKIYDYYCANCSSNLCETCFNNHDEKHNIIPLSNIFLKKDEMDYISNKNEEYNKIIQMYQNYINLNNLILDTYNNFKNNLYYIKNIKYLIRSLKNSELNNDKIKAYQNNIEKQFIILERFNFDCKTELTLDSDVIYLNWKNITKKSLESLASIKFEKMKEFQSVGTGIKDLLFLKNIKFPILQELYLTDNKISDISILEKVNFPILKIIYLNKNQIKEINVLKNVNFPELNKLFLDGNHIKDISVFESVPFTNLENLKLSKNFIIDISVLKNIKLKFLRLLDIKKNPIDYTLQENLDIINELRDKSIRIVY